MNKSIDLGGNFGKPSTRIGINFRPIFCLVLLAFFDVLAPDLFSNDFKGGDSQLENQVCNFLHSHFVQTKQKKKKEKTFNPKIIDVCRVSKECLE